MATKRIRKKRAKEQNRCPMCGEPLPKEEHRKVAGLSGRAVCASCIRAANFLLDVRDPYTHKNQDKELSVKSPVTLLSELDKKIIGQEQAKRSVAAALWKQQLRAKCNMTVPNPGLLLYGPTGCGKTALVREAASAMGLPFLSFDATTLSENGYRGRDAEDMVKDLVDKCGSIRKASYGVIFIDEVDKLAACPENEHRAAYSRGTQYSLLKLVEGTEVAVNGGILDTSNILFVYGGAFTRMKNGRKERMRRIGFGENEEPADSQTDCYDVEDFVAYGMEPELMGRIGRCIPLQALDEAELRRVLLESELSAYRTYQLFFKQLGKELILSESEIAYIVHKAKERGSGARGLNTLLEEWVEPKLFAVSEGEKRGLAG